MCKTRTRTLQQEKFLGRCALKSVYIGGAGQTAAGSLVVEAAASACVMRLTGYVRLRKTPANSRLTGACSIVPAGRIICPD